MTSLARKPAITEAEFAALAAARGIAYTPEELAEAHQAYGMVEAMVERVRGARKREFPPAGTFTPIGVRA
jgi:hypothetical protein